MGRNSSQDVYVLVELRARYRLNLRSLVSCSLLAEGGGSNGSLAPGSQGTAADYYLPPLLGAQDSRRRGASLVSSHLTQPDDGSGSSNSNNGSSGQLSCELDSTWDVILACPSSATATATAAVSAPPAAVTASNSSCPYCPVTWQLPPAPPDTPVPPGSTFGPLLSFNTSMCTNASQLLDPLAAYPAVALASLGGMSSTVGLMSADLDGMQPLLFLSSLYDVRDDRVSSAWNQLLADFDALATQNVADISGELASATLGHVLAGVASGSRSLAPQRPAVNPVNSSQLDAGLTSCVATRGLLFLFVVNNYGGSIADNDATGGRKGGGAATRVRAVGIRGENVVLGGLLLHQARLSQLDQAAGGPWARTRCAGRFVPLDPLCGFMLSSEAQREIAALAAAAAGHVGPEPVGTDPVMVNTSGLYQATLAAYPQDWYNTSVGAQEMSPTGSPYGFFYEPLEGFGEGYPLVVEINVSGKRAALLWATIMQVGHSARVRL